MERHGGDHHYHHPHPDQHEQPPPPPPGFHHHQFNNIDNHSSYHMPGAEPNGPPFAGGEGGGGFLSNGRKRGRFRFSPDQKDGGNNVKLYVAPVPRSITEEDVRRVFEEHGNVVQVVLPWDKRSGLQHAYCFVKYATVEEGDRAIRALNNLYTFPGESSPVKVRFADGERERHVNNVKVVEREQSGGSVDKLYVGCVNKQATKAEIEEVFSPYGCVEDVYIARDEMRQSRGCAFVKFSHRDMAVAAIEALHGTFTMRGCDQPLVVRFADPKKPRAGEFRGNCAFGRPNFGPMAQEPAVRPPQPSNFGDSMGRSHLPIASYPVNEISPNLQPQAVSYMKQDIAASYIPGQNTFPINQPPSQFSQIPLQHTQQNQAEFFQSSQQGASEMHKQTEILEQKLKVQSSSHESPQAVNNNQAASGTYETPPSPQIVDQQESDWSEHTCPDGYKYYYNCITYESRWEKPEEFASFQQASHMQEKLNQLEQQCHSLSAGTSAEEVDPPQKEVDHEDRQPKTSVLVDSASV